jgi:predicted kinase
MAVLIVLAGLPGSGKSSIAQALAKQIGAVWLRIDSIEQAIKEAGLIPNEAGYFAAHAMAADNLRLGRDVVADCVNPWMLTREVWRDVGAKADANVLEVEIVCSNPEEHRRRVEQRINDIPGLILPDWETVVRHDYHPWHRDHLTVDTAARSIAVCVGQIIAALCLCGEGSG